MKMQRPKIAFAGKKIAEYSSQMSRYRMKQLPGFCVALKGIKEHLRNKAPANANLCNA
jgi:hypothetical protein